MLNELYDFNRVFWALEKGFVKKKADHIKQVIETFILFWLFLDKLKLSLKQAYYIFSDIL